MWRWALLVCSQALRLDGYGAFRARYGRSWHRERRQLFEERRRLVQELNARDGSWRAELNAFADYTREEFLRLLGHRPAARPQSFLQLSSVDHVGFREQMRIGSDDLDGLPQSVDWRSLNTSSFHKAQGQSCGSCWAVAAVGALEMHAEIHSQMTPAELSVDELIDCVPNPRHCGGAGGCDGASAELAFQFVSQHGLRAQGVTGTCGATPYLRTQGFAHLRSNNLRSMLQALMQQGPLVVGVDASSWDLYGHGVFDACDRDATINHAVLLVGYGHEPLGLPFWRIRNSWGKDWGEDGYMRLLRHDSDSGVAGYCGTDRRPEEGVWCEGEQQQVQVCGMCGILSDATYPQQVHLA